MPDEPTETGTTGTGPTKTPSETASETPGESASARPAPRRRRTKAAAEPAGPPAEPEGEAAAKPKPRRRKAAAEATPPSEPTDTVAARPASARARKAAAAEPAAPSTPAPVSFQEPAAAPAPRRTRAKKAAPSEPEAPPKKRPTAAGEQAAGEEGGEEHPGRRRRRGRRGRGRGGAGEPDAAAAEQAEPGGEAAGEPEQGAPAEAGEGDEEGRTATTRRRRRRRRRGGGGGEAGEAEEAAEPSTEVRGVKGSTRIEAKRQRRREGRDSGRRRAPILSEAEFLARRESVERVMLVRQGAERTQVAVLEDGVLVEHYVTRTHGTSMIGNVYLGRVQNVLPSMEAAFVDIGRGRNAVLYAGEVSYDASALEGRPPRIEQALKSGQSVLVQVTKDPIGHKGARLTSQVSLPGRFMVYVPEGRMTGISRKLPDTERTRLKSILRTVNADDAGVIIRTAAEGASEEALSRDLSRLRAQWEDIQKKVSTAGAPALIYSEPDLVIRVIRDIFNEDFTRLVVQGDDEWDTVEQYVGHVAPDLVDRVSHWTQEGDVFAAYRVDEQIAKGLERKVWLPSGGSLVIDRTEAMTVIDVNTGRFTGAGGNLEETVTKNNLEAAEEIVRQLRLRDVGGIIVIDFIDMVLESNRELVLRRLLECLGRDRTKHQVAEVTSLGLVQMTRKRVGQGLLDAFSETCPECGGRGVKVTIDPVQPAQGRSRRARGGRAAATGSGPADTEAPAPAADEALTPAGAAAGE